MWAFLRILTSATLTAMAVPFYLRWGSDQADRQLDKMQKAVHFTPGAESPVPPEVVAGAAGLGISHFAVGRLLKLRWWQAIASLFMGVMGGVLVFLYRLSAEES